MYITAEEINTNLGDEPPENKLQPSNGPAKKQKIEPSSKKELRSDGEKQNSTKQINKKTPPVINETGIHHSGMQ